MMINVQNVRLKILSSDNTLNRFRKMTFASLEASEAIKRGLSPTEASVLIILYETAEASMNELAQRCCLTNSRITRVMDTLVEKNYARRYFKPNNRRTVYATATELGIEIINKNNATILKNFIEMVAQMTQEELDTLYKCYETILELYEKQCGFVRSLPHRVPQIEGENIDKGELSN